MPLIQLDLPPNCAAARTAGRVSTSQRSDAPPCARLPRAQSNARELTAPGRAHSHHDRAARARRATPRAAGDGAAAARSRPVDFCGFSLIVDDIVFPDGRTLMGVLGGGGPQTLWGYQLYTGQRGAVGLAAGVGPDLPAHCREWLQAIGCVHDGLSEAAGACTPRAWQVLEVWRTPPCDALYAQLRPDFEALPPALAAARGYALGVNPDRPPLQLLQRLKTAAEAQGGLLAAEPYVGAAAPLAPRALHQLLALCHVFSPNEAEARSMTGLEGAAPRDVARRLLDAGAGVLALRRGERGAIVADGASGEAWSIPAVPDATAVDPTGCGNAFTGAFMAALLAGAPLLQAGLWGCAAGSLMLEAQGVPAAPPRDARPEAERRVHALAPLAKPFVLL